MSFWSDLGKIQPWRFIKRNVDAVTTVIGQAARDVNKNRVFKAITAPQRIIAGSGLALFDKDAAQRIFSLDNKEIMASELVGKVAVTVGAPILAPAVFSPPGGPQAPTTGPASEPSSAWQILTGGGLNPEKPMEPQIFPYDLSDRLRQEAENWAQATAPAGSLQLPSADPAPQEAVGPDGWLPAGPGVNGAQPRDWLESLFAWIAAFFSLIFGGRNV